MTIFGDLHTRAFGYQTLIETSNITWHKMVKIFSWLMLYVNKGRLAFV